MEYTARLYDTDGLDVPAENLVWSVADAMQDHISTSGVFTPKGAGETWVIARLPNGVRDSAHVLVRKGPTQP